MTRRTGHTHYSRRELGTERNHHRAVRFDLTDGCVGITAFEDNHSGTVADRVLLTREQFAALVRFVKAPKQNAA